MAEAARRSREGSSLISPMPSPDRASSRRPGASPNSRRAARLGRRERILAASVRVVALAILLAGGALALTVASGDGTGPPRPAPGSSATTGRSATGPSSNHRASTSTSAAPSFVDRAGAGGRRPAGALVDRPV